MKTLHVDLGERGYDISIGAGLIKTADKLFDLQRRVFIITDSGVPKAYAETIAGLCKISRIYTVPSGERSKSLSTMEKLLFSMLEFGMTRKDAVVAVGGGVVGDLAGFTASTYMRGIDFYNVPTTLLSQVDSSIGGKTAVNLGETKNAVGSFYQPKGVLIDPEVLKTLPERQVNAGLAEALKMSLTSDAKLFHLFETCDNIDDSTLEGIIISSLIIKKEVVEKDEKESGLRKILNFGHTLGHGIESECGLGALLHGECVALGMLAVVPDDLYSRLISVYKKLGLPTEFTGSVDHALSFVKNDKKATSGAIEVILVDKPGAFRIEKMSFEAFEALVKKVY